MLRRVLASASLVAIAVLGRAPHGHHATMSIVVAGVLAASGLLFMRRSAMAQTLARGGAWSVIFPGVTVAIMTASRGYALTMHMLWPSLLAGAALIVARPLLGDERARSTFAPVALRSWFLAATATAIGAGIATAELALAYLSIPELFKAGLALALLGTTLLASGIGLVKMRGWGIFLGALSAIVAVVTELSFGWHVLTWPLVATAIPGALMVATLLAARAGFGSTSRDVRGAVEHEPGLALGTTHRLGDELRVELAPRDEMHARIEHALDEGDTGDVRERAAAL